MLSRGSSARLAMNEQSRWLQYLKLPSIIDCRIFRAVWPFQAPGRSSIAPIGVCSQSGQQMLTDPWSSVSIVSNGFVQK